jgi:hypothetical protein
MSVHHRPCRLRLVGGRARQGLGCLNSHIDAPRALRKTRVTGQVRHLLLRSAARQSKGESKPSQPGASEARSKAGVARSRWLIGVRGAVSFDTYRADRAALHERGVVDQSGRTARHDLVSARLRSPVSPSRERSAVSLVTLARLQQLWETRVQVSTTWQWAGARSCCWWRPREPSRSWSLRPSSAPFAAGSLNLRATLGTLTQTRWTRRSSLCGRGGLNAVAVRGS